MKHPTIAGTADFRPAGFRSTHSSSNQGDGTRGEAGSRRQKYDSTPGSRQACSNFAGKAFLDHRVQVAGDSLDNGQIKVQIDIPKERLVSWRPPGSLSDSREKPLRKVEDPIEIAPWEVVTLSAE